MDKTTIKTIEKQKRQFGDHQITIFLNPFHQAIRSLRRKNNLAATKWLIIFPLICNHRVAAISLSIPPSRANDLVAIRCGITLHFRGIYLVPLIYNFIIRYITIWQPPYGYLPPLQVYQFGGHQIIILIIVKGGDNPPLMNDPRNNLVAT